MRLITPWLGRLGRSLLLTLTAAAEIFNLLQGFLYWTCIAPFQGKKPYRRAIFARQLIFIGNESLFIIALVSFCVGAVLALQAAYQLKQFGAVIYTGSLVSVSMTRELGPMVTAIVLAGRVGASITAELGTMKVQEEIDALETMGIPSLPYLVVPRILALLIMVPVLTIFSYAVGMLGGYTIGVLSLGIAPGLYWDANFNVLVPKDLWTGLAKSGVFACLVGLISTWTGLQVEGGADGVGKATTRSVVISIISIIIADGLCTALFYYVFP